MTAQPQPEEPSGRADTLPNVDSVFMPTTADLDVLLAEINRVRSADAMEAPSPFEAMTLAAAAIRMVEAQLARAGAVGIPEADIATAREALQGALEALHAAVNRVEADTAARDVGPFRARWRRRKSHSTPR